MDITIGIDEVGRGSWAGPLLVVSARAKTILPGNLADSKKLSRTQREALYDILVESCDFGEGWVSAAEIDEFGLSGAMRLAVERSLDAIKATNSSPVIMDGHINYCPTRFQNVVCTIKADSLVPVVSAASILAKVLRDRYMIELSQNYPNYAFDKHVGYGTLLHRQRLAKFGPSDVHRRSFKPVNAEHNYV